MKVSWALRTIFTILVIYLSLQVFRQAEAQNVDWDVRFSVCDDNQFLFVVEYFSGPANLTFHWESGDYSGSFHLWPDRAPMAASIYTDANWVHVEAGGLARRSGTSEDCRLSTAQRPTYVYLVAVLDALADYWVCGGTLVVNAAGEPLSSTVQTMPWKPAGGLEIPYSVLILSEYIDPSLCTALFDGVPVQGWYTDYARFTCLAFLSEDLNCPGRSDYH